MDNRRRRIPSASPSSSQSSILPALPDASVKDRQYEPLVSVHTRAGTLSLRDAVRSDMEAYVKYWHYSGERIKDVLGIDRRKLGTPDDTRERFLGMIRAPDTFPRNVIFTATLNGHVIGYTNMNRYGAHDNFVHLHLYRRSIRAVLGPRAARGSLGYGAGLAAALIGPGLSMYFRLFPVRRLVLQTRPANSAINKALDLYDFPTETMYVEHPAGLAAAGEQCLRYVYRKDVPRMLERGAALIDLDPATDRPGAGSTELPAGWRGRKEGTMQ